MSASTARSEPSAPRALLPIPSPPRLPRRLAATALAVVACVLVGVAATAAWRAGGARVVEAPPASPSAAQRAIVPSPLDAPASPDEPMAANGE